MVAIRAEELLPHNIAIRWRPDLSKKRDEPWFLMTDLGHKAERTCQPYSRRMSIEELFRDGKSKRNGQSLRDTRIGKPDRFDRFLLVVALAYLVLVGVGLRAKLDFEPSAWCTTRRARECSVFTIGRAMVDRVKCPPDQILRMIRWVTIEVGSKWG